MTEGRSTSGSGLGCGGGHLFVWGTPGAMPDGWPCVCGMMRSGSQAREIARLEANNAKLREQVEALRDVLGRVLALTNGEYRAAYDLAADIKAEVEASFVTMKEE